MPETSESFSWVSPSFRRNCFILWANLSLITVSITPYYRTAFVLLTPNYRKVYNSGSVKKMDDLTTINQEIHKIGCEMLNCSQNCPGVSLDRETGILPRCLIFEAERSEDLKNGCIIVGINPGHCKADERKYYLDKGINYGTIIDYWRQHISGREYYKALRKFAEELGLTGSILWTELVKCENKQGLRELPLQTFRTCTMKYLSQELNIVPADWPLIAVGKEAYHALAYLYPRRTLIGIPHPTGSYGHFKKLFDEEDRLLEQFKQAFKQMTTSSSGLGWFDGNNGRVI